MSYRRYRSLKNQGKKRKGKKRKVEDDEAVSCSHDFWNEAPEDLLTEIFVRLLDCRSAARASTVCRRWRSSIRRNPRFIRKIPWTMMFSITDFLHDHLIRPVPKPRYFPTLCRLHSDEWMFLHGKKFPENSLDFLPSPMMIIASCKDSLLVSPGLRFNDDLYICNPITKQFSLLPSIPRRKWNKRMYKDKGRAFALVPGPPSGCEFKVVEVVPPYGPLDRDNRGPVEVSVYASESRKWETRRVLGPFWMSSTFINIVRSNEVLFWVGESWSLRMAVFYLDLSREKLGLVDIPQCIRGEDIIFQYHEIGVLHVSDGSDELRLVHHDITLYTREIVRLRVWRLNSDRDEGDDSTDWVLVHDKKLRMPKNLVKGEKELMGTFVHPTNGDKVFVVWGKSVFEHNLVDETYYKMSEFPVFSTHLPGFMLEDHYHNQHYSPFVI